MTSRSDSRVLRALASSLEAGLGLPEALELLRSRTAAGSSSPATRAATLLKSGLSLADALHRAGLIDQSESCLLSAGELSGEIPRTLLLLAGERDRRAALRSELFRRASYPLLVLHLAALVSGWLAYLQGHSAVLAASWLLGPIWAAALAIAWVWRRSKHDAAVAGFILGSPVIGPHLAARATGIFLRILRSAYAAGLPVARAAEIARESVDNVVVRRRLDGLVAGLRAGQTLTEQLASLPRLAPELAGLIAAGERSGSLVEAIDQVLKISEQELESARRHLLTTFGAALHGLAILVVAIKVIGFYAAYFARLG